MDDLGNLVEIPNQPGMYWWQGMICDLGWNPREQIQRAIDNEMRLVRENPVGYVIIGDRDELIPVSKIVSRLAL